MNLRRTPLLIITGATVVAVGAWWFAPSSATRPSPTAEPKEKPAAASTASVLPSRLANIFEEPDEIRRLHLLTVWVDEHTLDEIATAMVSAPPDVRKAVNELALLKLRDQTDLLPESERPGAWVRYWVNFSGTRPPFPPSPRETLLAQADTDPAGAFQRASTLRMSGKDRQQLLQEIIAHIAKKDPRQALALLSATHAVNQTSARNDIAEKWAVIDPHAAFDWARNQPNPKDLLSSVMSAWGKVDPESALEAVLSMPPGRISDYTTRNLLSKWMTTSPQESAKWIQRLPNPDSTLLRAAFETLSRTHPEAVASLLQKPMSAGTRREGMKDLIANWAKNDPASAMRWLQTQPKDSAYFAAAGSLAGKLASKDPASALAFYRTLPDDAPQNEVIRTLADNLPKAQAIDWLLTLPASADTSRALQAALDRMGYAEPAQFLALLNRVPPGPQQDPIYIAATRKQLDRDPAATATWIKALPTDATREAVLRGIAPDWAKSAPEDAAAYARGLVPGKALDALIPWVRYELGQRDPAAAADWMLTLPDGRKARTQTANAFAALGEVSPTAALDRLRALPAGNTRTAAFGGLIDGLARTRPEEAARILVTVGSPTEQLTHVGSLAADWGKAAPAAASKWVQTLPPGEMRDQGLARIADPLASSDPAAALALLPLASADKARYELASASLLALQTRDEQSARVALGKLNLPPADMDRLKAQLDSRAEH